MKTEVLIHRVDLLLIRSAIFSCIEMSYPLTTDLSDLTTHRDGHDHELTIFSCPEDPPELVTFRSDFGHVLEDSHLFRRLRVGFIVKGHDEYFRRNWRAMACVENELA